MASRIVLGIVIIAMLGASGFFVMNYKLESHYENGKFAYMKITPRGNSGGPPPTGTETPANNNLPPPQPNRSTFRIATFNVGGLDEGKLSNARIGDILSRLLPRFELVAVQGLRGKNQGVPVRLVEQINALSGRQYDFATCPTQQRDGIEHYSAFIFDKAAVEIDRSTVHFVEEQRRFRHKPLVGSFRARGPKPAEAFTFTLVAVETDPEKAGVELDLLADVFRAVRDDGRNEDDIIMLGDFQADDNHLGRLGKVLGITAAISDTPSTTRGTRLADNLLFDRRATSEFTGRAEVFDTMREFELTMQAAADISDHLPVWAEFSVFEGGPRGFVPHVQ